MAFKSVLIADGDPDAALALARTLEAVGASVMLATDGFDALTLARRRTPDLIISEIELPGLTGFELRRELGSDATLGRIPFIFVAALSNAKTRLAGLRLGAAD